MNFIIKTLCLIVLTATNGFTASKLTEHIRLLDIESVTSSPKRMVRHHTKFPKHLTKSLHGRSYTSFPFVQKRYNCNTTVIKEYMSEKLIKKLEFLCQGGEYADPTISIGFRQLFLPVEDNKEIIKSFLNTFVPYFYHNPAKDVNASTSLFDVPHNENKNQTSLDMSIVSQNGSVYAINLMVERHFSYDRNIFEKSYEDIMWYKNLKPVITIKVGGFRNIQHKKSIDSSNTDDFHEQGVLIQPQIISLELPRTRQDLFLSLPKKDFTILDWWLNLFKFAPQYTHKINKILEETGVAMPAVINQAFERLCISKLDNDKIIEYTNAIWEGDYFITILSEKEKGRQENALDVAERMIKKGRPFCEVCEMTSLSLEVVKDLSKKIEVTSKGIKE